MFHLAARLTRRTSDDRNWPATLRELSTNLYSDKLLAEIGPAQRLYLCPHRHLHQIPLHALLLPDGSCLIEKFEVTYATKLSHVVSLLRNPPNAASRDLWIVGSGHEFHELRELPPLVRRRGRGSSLVPANSWGARNVSIRELLSRAARARQSILCCHGQMDETRPGKARLRLWGGGRLVADDIHRWAQQPGALAGSEWILAACESGASKVTLQTAPGVGLSLATTGARRVTSSLYEVTPQTAARMIRLYNSARHSNSVAPFTAPVRGLYFNGRNRRAWAESAAFISYGPFENPQAEPGQPRHQ